MRIFRWAFLVWLHPVVVQADDWPQWRGPERDGVWRETGILNSFEPGDLKPVWSSPIGAGYSGPTVQGNRVYVTSRVEEPEQVEQVHCIDRLTGIEVWKFVYSCEYSNIGYPLGPRAAVLISDGKAYALGAMGHFHCLDANDGKLLWKKDLAADYGTSIPGWGIAASPLADEDRVYLQVGGTDGSGMVAFDKTSGKEEWRAMESAASYSAPRFIQNGNRKQILAWTGDWFATLDPETGHVAWKHPFKKAKMIINVADPVLDPESGRVFFTSFYDGSYLFTLNPEKGGLALLWERRGRSEMHTDALHSIISTPVIRGDYVYGLDSHGEFRCLRLDNGDRIWSEESIVEKARWGTAFFVQQGDLTWIFTENGELILGRLSPEGFERISSARIIEPTTFLPRRNGNILWSHPAFAYKHIFVRNDRELISIDLTK
ncbi:MAG: PQQ-binding-like beta-propeller repeat protein [Verrucomicrobiae bacterium]|nr:PQQ-binding-like beta-propeller repeat protein [Verrucomicrobiae bacterium]